MCAVVEPPVLCSPSLPGLIVNNSALRNRVWEQETTLLQVMDQMSTQIKHMASIMIDKSLEFIIFHGF